MSDQYHYAWKYNYWGCPRVIFLCEACLSTVASSRSWLLNRSPKAEVWKLFGNRPQMADEKFPTVLIRFEAIWPYQRRNLAVQHLCYQQDGCHWTFLRWVKCWTSHQVRVCCEKRKSAAVAWGSCVHRSRHGAPHPTSRRERPNEHNFAVPLPKKRVIRMLQILILPNAVLLPHCCLRIGVLPKAELSQQFATTRCRTKAECGRCATGPRWKMATCLLVCCCLFLRCRT